MCQILFADDILKVIYAPQKAFKKIIENPKYLGALIILLLFVGIQISYEYAQISKTEIEQTSPSIINLGNLHKCHYVGERSKCNVNQ